MRALALPMILGLLLALPLLWRAGNEALPIPGADLAASPSFQRIAVTPTPPLDREAAQSDRSLSDVRPVSATER